MATQDGRNLETAHLLYEQYLEHVRNSRDVRHAGR